MGGRRTSGTCRCLLLCILAAACYSEALRTTVNDVLSELPTGVEIVYQGPAYEDFERPMPEVVETTLFDHFESYFNQTQEFYADEANTYLARGRQAVVSIKGGRVTGVLGSVYDYQGHLFTEFASDEADAELTSKLECKHFKRLATSIQKYGHMYHHFIQEVMPRIVMLLPFFDEDTKLLTFGSPYELSWLKQLGVSAAHIEVYDPEQQYCADELLVPTLSPVITPPRESFNLLRESLGAAEPLPESERDLIVYCSRQKATDRQVSDEEELLYAIRTRYPSSKLVVFSGSETVPETIQLFRRARMVVGMHGAGLSHSVFSAPGTALVEFLFMYDPPMMSWHTSAALGLRYIMVPLAQSWWLDQQVHVATQDVLDALALVLEPDEEECDLGFIARDGQCVACPIGTYRPFGAPSCLPCAAGRYAGNEASPFCSTCPSGSFSAAASSECKTCPEGATTMFPGSTSGFQCMSPQRLEDRLEKMFAQDVLTNKLVQLPALQGRPKTALGWISAALSPRNLLTLWHQRSLRQAYLKKLFDDDETRGPPVEQDEYEYEVEEEGEEEPAQALQERRQLQYGRHLLYRRVLQTDTAARHLLYKRRSLSTSMDSKAGVVDPARQLPQARRLQYRRSMQMYGRHLATGTSRRLQYGRRLNSGTPRKLQYGRHLISGARHLAANYGRHLATYGRRLVSGTARTLAGYRRHLSTDVARTLQGYRRHLGSSLDRVLQYGRRLRTRRNLQYRRH